MNIRDRIYQILQFNDNLAFSILELVDRITDQIWIVRYFKVIHALARLERKGLIESKHIGIRKYYRVKREFVK
ncbi:unnamed protein product [marine sediment metagenome]|uniref:Uncharacterized protein n=1 Tax=marine sediment metagenome TaxID=412755 RepID=X1GJJ4_9ZZZZ